MVEFRVIPRDEIEAGWGWLGPLIAPAVAQDRHVTLETVRQKLLSGVCAAIAAKAEQSAGVLVFEINEIDGRMVCWASYIAGQSKLKPKAWIAMIRDLMDKLCALAKDAGCTEIRIGGRDWSRIFSDFDFIDQAVNNDMRKAL